MTCVALHVSVHLNTVGKYICFVRNNLQAVVQAPCQYVILYVILYKLSQLRQTCLRVSWMVVLLQLQQPFFPNQMEGLEP